MKDPNDAHPPLFTINLAMTDEYRDIVVTEVLEQLKAKKVHSKALDTALQKVLTVTGYKHPTKAPLHKLHPATVRAFTLSEEVMAAVLTLWIKFKEDLRTRMNDFLEAQGVALSPINYSTRELLGFHSRKELLDHTEIFQANFPDFDQNDVRLMYVCLRGTLYPPQELHHLFDPDDTPRRPEPETGYMWTAWLERLHDLPAAAPEWDSVDDFLESLAKIAMDKIQERRDTHYLKITLKSLCETHADQLAFFGFDECCHWSVENLPLDQCAPITESIGELQTTLTDYGHAAQQQPANIKERRKQARQLDKLETQALQLYERLQEMFAPSPSTAPPEPPDQATIEQEDQPVDPAAKRKKPRKVAARKTKPAATKHVPAPPERQIESNSSTSNQPEPAPEPASSAPVKAKAKAATDQPGEVAVKKPARPSKAGQTGSKSAATNGKEITHSAAAAASEDNNKLEPDSKDEPSRANGPAPAQLNGKAHAAENGASPPVLGPDELRRDAEIMLSRWLGSWPGLPKAYLLTTWLAQEHPDAAQKFPSPDLCEMACYALQPFKPGRTGGLLKEAPAHVDQFELLWDGLQTASDELKVATWQVVAALVTLHGDTTLQDLLEFRYSWVNQPEFGPWAPLAEALHLFWGQTTTPIYEVSFYLDHPHTQVDLPKAMANVRKEMSDAFRLIKKPGNSQRLRNHIVREKLGWLPELLTRSAPDDAALEWAANFNPDAALVAWADEAGLKPIDPAEPEYHPFLRNLRILQRAVTHWGNLASNHHDDQAIETINHFKQLRETITLEGESWRAAWTQAGTKWPTLAGWSLLLLQRLAEVFDCIDQNQMAGETYVRI